MPIQDESQMGPGAAGRSRKRSLLFQPIASYAEAKRVARRAAIVALLFAAMYVVGIFATMQGISPVTGQRDPEIAAYMIFVTAFNIVALVLILLFAWRIGTGRGFVSAAILLVWFVAEAATKIVGGSAGIGFGLAYIVMALLLADGVRATWAGSKLAKLPDRAQIGVFE